MKKQQVFMILGLLVSLSIYGCSTPIEEKKTEITSEHKESEERQLISLKTRYYYMSLQTNKDRENYEKLLDAMTNRTESIDLEIDSIEKLRFLYKCVMWDYPELFYVESYSYIENSDTEIRFIPNYTISEVEQEEAERTIERYVESIGNKINHQMSEYEIEKIIYDFIAENTDYTENSEYNQSAYSVALGKSVCLGYSKMFQMICERFGLQCIIITGRNEEGVGHAWNCVRVDGNWYMVDCTNSKGMLADSKDKISYYLFNVTEQQILRVYSIENITAIPKCDSLENEYFFRNKLYFDEPDTERYKGIIEGAELTGQTDLIIQCSDIKVLDEMCSWLIDERNIFEILGEDKQVNYVKSNEMLTLQVEW